MVPGMGGPSAVEVLLALLDTDEHERVGGGEVMARLSSAGVDATPSRVLARLVGLEASGHVAIDRGGDYRFSLTSVGQQAAFDLGPGRPVEVTLLMADLAGYVSYTARAGDAAAHAVAAALGRAATRAVRDRGGDVVKLIGDGVLATAPSVARAVDAAREIAGACRGLDGGPWALRAAVHAGHAVAHGGDVFGADVNLVSRLCALAPTGHVLVTGAGGEPYTVRGLDEPVAAKAVAL